MQCLLQVFARHSVVQIGYLDFCSLRERLRRTFRARATRGSKQRRGAAGHARGCTPFDKEGKDSLKMPLTSGFAWNIMQMCMQHQHLDDQEPWVMTSGLKLLCRFNLLKAEGVLIWNSADLRSPCSNGDSVALRGLEPSLLCRNTEEEESGVRGEKGSTCMKRNSKMCFICLQVW